MAEQEAAHAEIDWSTAEVTDGKLTVKLTGEPSKDWAKRVGAIVDRLQSSGGWNIAVDEKRIEVEPVEPGAEADVRHFVESAVLQANADFAPDESDEEEQAEGSEQDAAMTEAFREFGDASGDDGD
jgi:hypothetical protein